jgi:hypothetical protein
LQEFRVTLDELLGGDAKRAFLILYRIKKAGGVTPPAERRKALTDALDMLNGERTGRFFEEAGHVSTSAWIVRVNTDVTANDVVQYLKLKAKLSAGVDYLWAVEVVEPLNESHITRTPKP